MAIYGIMRGKNKLKLAGLIPCCFLLPRKKKLDRESQLGPSLACQSTAPTSECLLPRLISIALATYVAYSFTCIPYQGVRRQKFGEGATFSKNDISMMTSQRGFCQKNRWGG